jgi:hypothetical protein
MQSVVWGRIKATKFTSFDKRNVDQIFEIAAQPRLPGEIHPDHKKDSRMKDSKAQPVQSVHLLFGRCLTQHTGGTALSSGPLLITTSMIFSGKPSSTVLRKEQTEYSTFQQIILS